MSGYNISLQLSLILAGAAPIILAAAGETIIEKSGVTNLSIEGSVILSAMTAFAVTCRTGSPVTGFAAAAAAGAAVSFITALFSVYAIRLQIAAGIALTFMATDLAYFIGSPYAGIKGYADPLPRLPVPYLNEIPYIGKIFFNHNITVYIGLAAVLGVWLFLHTTRTGLGIRAVGENPESAIARGMNPSLIRLCCSISGGILTGLAGASFSLAAKPGWGNPQGCEGAGWIALGLVVSGNGNPLITIAGACLFSFLQIVCLKFQVWFPGSAMIIRTAPFPLMIAAFIIIKLLMGLKKKEHKASMPLCSNIR
jgi:simple sugar transport system permease protein